jgi:hypothetical protein
MYDNKHAHCLPCQPVGKRRRRTALALPQFEFRIQPISRIVFLIAAPWKLSFCVSM